VLHLSMSQLQPVPQAVPPPAPHVPAVVMQPAPALEGTAEGIAAEQAPAPPPPVVSEPAAPSAGPPQSCDALGAAEKVPAVAQKGKGPKKVWDSARYMCEHKRRKYLCRDCGGSQICEHNKVRTGCKDCKGGTICVHQRRRAFCKECMGGAVCPHKVEPRHPSFIILPVLSA